MSLESKNIKKIFPYLNSKKNKEIIYFDNAATTHKPQCVIDSISDFYKYNNSNIHRSIHKPGASATEQYESTRLMLAEFIGAGTADEIILTSGTTESINLAASSYGESFIKRGDIVLVSKIEHHSNMLPWQRLVNKFGAIIQEIPVNLDLSIDLLGLQKLLTNRVKIIVLHHVSNVTGVVQNIKAITDAARVKKIPVFVDGAQAPAHINVDVGDLGCDFYCFSGHKMFGPTGTGVLFVKKKYLEKLSPYKTGGQMVSLASFKTPQWSEPPLKFEAGTPNIAGVVGLGAAVQFLKDYGLAKILETEKALITYMSHELTKVPNLIHYGNNNKIVPIFAFNVKNAHHYDVSTFLSEKSVLIRSGHLCNQGLMKHLGIDGCLRASLAFYNTPNEIDRFVDGLKKIISFLDKR